MNEDKQNYFKVIEGTTLYYEHYVKYLQKQLETYENMRKEVLDKLNNWDEEKSLAIDDYYLKDDLLNILNKGGEDK